jgi:hypothetical protein
MVRNHFKGRKDLRLDNVGGRKKLRRKSFPIKLSSRDLCGWRFHDDIMTIKSSVIMARKWSGIEGICGE